MPQGLASSGHQPSDRPTGLMGAPSGVAAAAVVTVRVVGDAE